MINRVMLLASKKNIVLLFIPIGWGVISYLIFSILKPNLPITSLGSVPLWMGLWLLQMFAAIPFWIWLLRLDLEHEQRISISLFKLKISLGTPLYFLIAAYLAGISAIPFYDKWYGEWFIFGVIVSPIFEELFSRNLLTPWLRKNWIEYLSAAIISSASFSLMHWGFNNAEAFSLSAQQQAMKFFSHFIFGFVLCLIFRFTKSIQFMIWLHIASNLQATLTKL
jgi:membrane protease YdiL (CAAX protease family)